MEWHDPKRVQKEVGAEKGAVSKNQAKVEWFKPQQAVNQVAC